MKIKQNAIQTLRSAANIQVVSGGNKHPWCDPVTALFGEYKSFPDLLDFFCDVSHKKGLAQRAMKLKELFWLIEKSYNEETDTVSPKTWQKLIGADAPVEGSAYTVTELNGLSLDVKRHYAMVAVPTGFDWAARGINLRPLLEDCDLWEEIPQHCRKVWEVTILMVIWIVYEALGLGGMDREVLEFHRLVRQYARQGYLFQEGIGENLPAKFEWQEAYSEAENDYHFLEWIWFRLLKANGIPQKWAEDGDVFELVMFLAHGREIVNKIQKGIGFGQYLDGYQFGGLDVEQIRALMSACQLLRDAAKGRLTLQDVAEKSHSVEGVLGYLTQKDPAGMLDYLEERVQDSPTEVSVATVALLDQVRLNEAWVLGRQSAKFNVENY